MKKTLKIVLFNVAAIFAILALFEGFHYFLVRHPSLLKHFPQGIKNSIGYLYSTGERKIIQFSPDCARFDPELGYTLKPGSCLFGGTEFSNAYSINSLGLRDDEESLHNPEVIVVGDSYAMGWGVDQQDSFAAVLQKKSGLKVLNAALSSYGTAREMIILRRLDTGNLRFLIIQYCENDFDENKEFFQKGNHLYTMTKDEYTRHTNLNMRPKNYYLGKYIALKLEKKWKEIKMPKKQAQDKSFSKDDVDLFLNAVMTSGVNLDKAQIIVFDAVGKNDFDRTFVSRLRERIKNAGYPSYIKNMIALDITKVITKDQYYVLDDHWTKDGHLAVADALVRQIEQVSAARAEKRMNR